MKKPVSLIGFMGSGKSTLGRQLAKEWKQKFIDLDTQIVKMYDMSIQDIFKEYGEKGFRKRETDTLKDILSGDNEIILSLGGGTPCYNNNLDLIKAKTHSIYLQLSPLELSYRLIRSRNPRPLVKDKSDKELLKYIESEIQKREVFYTQADQVIQSDCIQLSDLLTFISL